MNFQWLFEAGAWAAYCEVIRMRIVNARPPGEFIDAYWSRDRKWEERLP